IVLILKCEKTAGLDNNVNN
uniref:Uncharacterized protein n=1 Tax=Strongyloides papillosus TaxID=174720 RepID=A0A0N5B915_STREA